MTIKQKQNLLAYLGYYEGEIDGIWGKLSKAATKAFQEDYGIAASGICDATTEKALKDAVCNGMPEKKDWWESIKYFTKDEFKCKCGGRYCKGYPAEMSQKLVKIADEVREHFGAPIIVSSGMRCNTHNANVGGVSNSRHKYGKAMDFCVSGHSASSVLPYVQSKSGIRYAYAIDKNYIHMDIE